MKNLTEEQKKAIELYNNCNKTIERLNKEIMQTSGESEYNSRVIKHSFSNIKLLEEIFGKELFVEQKDIRERVKSWEDALREVKETDFYKNFHGFLHNLLDFSNSGNKYIKSVYAYCKLLVIVEALNEGWKADFSNEKECKYEVYYEGSELKFDIGTRYEAKNSPLILRFEELAQHLIDNFSDLLKDYFMI